MAKTPNWSKPNLPPGLDPAIIAYLKTLSASDWEVLNRVRHKLEELSGDAASDNTMKAQVV